MSPTDLLPAFGSGLWNLLAFVVALSVVVTVHEYGHYIVGKKSGIFPEVFSLGFGPVLFSRRDRDGTLWQIAALPFGGYVKFRGDANASGGTDEAAVAELSQEERRGTMAGAPLWARSATVAAGPIFNFVLSAIILTGLAFSTGQLKDPMTIGSVNPLPVEQGLEPGDVVLRIEGIALADRSLGDVLDDLPQEASLTYSVERGSSRLDVAGPYPVPPLVGGVAPRSAASDAGLKQGDVIVGVNGSSVATFEELRLSVEGSEGAPLALQVWRAGSEIDMVLTPRRVDEPQADNSFETHYRIGVVGGFAFEPATESPGLGQALLLSSSQVWRIITGSLSGLWHMATGAISSCNLSGPIGIAEASGTMASQGSASFIGFIALLSTAVGLMNLFPVPVLDGGHLLFFAYEAVSGRKPNERVLSVLMTVGLAMILTLMVFAVSNDLFCP